jgi:formate dehydrogenase major subunit
MLNEVTKFADIIFGVRSAYEKEGVYINAERRLHLSQSLVDSDLPDDWQVIQGVANALNSHWHYQENEDVWSEVQKVAKNRFAGADYNKLRTKRREGSGLQWPIFENETPILHQETFRTEKGLGKFIYQSYKLRGQIQEILENQQDTSSEYFYLSTGRMIRHYNNSSQTKASSKLSKHHQEDILLVSAEDKDFFKSMRLVKLKTEFGETAPLQIKITNKLKKGTLFTTFHHSKSKINFIFGDVADELTKTAQFKSIKVKVINIE